MKRLLIIKRMEIMLQVMSFVIPFVWIIVAGEAALFPYVYYSVGAVQLQSWFLNKIFLDRRLKDRRRYTYEKALFVVFLVTAFVLCTLCMSKNLFYLAGLLFALAMFLGSPVMALYYLSVTVAELAFIRRINGRIQSFKTIDHVIR